MRMLVNGRSIVEEPMPSGFSYYHVELDRHGLLLAEGLAMESYLDTGNRTNFIEAPATALRPDLALKAGHERWRTDAYAPLMTAREAVEPIWSRLSRRAVQAGVGDDQVEAAGTFSDDPELRVLLDDGQLLAAWQQRPSRLMFRIPTGRRPLALRSRCARPEAVIGPFIDDRRMLGVKVRQISVWVMLDEQVLDLNAVSTTGWYSMEADGRWTDGEGRLELPHVGDGTIILDVAISGTLRYPAVVAEAGYAA